MRKSEEKVLAALPAAKSAALPPREIHKLVPDVARVTVRHALLSLTRRGLVKADGPNMFKKYWRAS